MCMPGVYKGWKRAPDSLELELAVVSWHTGAENQTRFSIKAGRALSHWSISWLRKLCALQLPRQTEDFQTRGGAVSLCSQEHGCAIMKPPNVEWEPAERFVVGSTARGSGGVDSSLQIGLVLLDCTRKEIRLCGDRCSPTKCQITRMLRWFSKHLYFLFEGECYTSSQEAKLSNQGPII